MPLSIPLSLLRALGAVTARRLGVVAFLLLACSAPVFGSEAWLTDYDQALAESTRTGKPVLTLFTGSDWCPHCRTLEKQVFDSSAFSEWAEDHVVLLMVDLPQSGISPAVRSERSQLCVKYGVRTFPSVLVLNAVGEKLAEQKGYRGASAANWISQLAGKLPAKEPAKESEGELAGPVFTTLRAAVDSARETQRPIVLVISGSTAKAATSRSATLVNDPDFASLAAENFVVAALPASSTEGGATVDASLEQLLGGQLEADAVEVIVTDDGETPVFMASGSQSPQRIVSGLRRFLVARQTARRPTGTVR